MKLVKTTSFALRGEMRDGGSAYAAVLACCAGALAVVLLAVGWDLGDLWTVAALCVIAAVSERGLVRLTSTTSQSISILPTLFAAVLFGPLAGMLVGAASLASEILQPPHLKWLTYTSSRAISGALTGLAASYCLTLSTSDFLATAVATLVGAVVAEVLDVVFAAIAAQIRGTRSPW